MSPNQVDELFRLMTNAVAGIQRLEQGQTELTQKVSNLEQGQDELQRGQDELRQEFEGFRDETRQNFVEVKKELRQMNRKVNLLANDVVEARGEVNELADRVDIIEEKQAA